MTERARLLLAALGAAWLAAAPAASAAPADADADGAAAAPGAEPEAPCALRDPLRRPLFGDLHVHTTYSLDASTQGTRTTPAEAYRFAQGAEIGLHPFAPDGTPLRHARLDRPLDFAAVTDHAELFGETEICRAPGYAGYASLACRVYRGWPRLAFFLMNGRGRPRFRFCGPDDRDCAAAARGVWQTEQEAAEAAYDRSSACAFTSFVAVEWTASGPRAANLHRNVIFRSDRVPELPPNAIDQPTREDLWAHLDRVCRPEDGCRAVVIPHNSDLSGGQMFPVETRRGVPLTAEAARRESEIERLVEVIQHKGSSECSAATDPSDELCGFENLPYDTFMGRFLPVLREPDRPLSFTRHVQARGLEEQQRIGANPFRFGLVGSTDTHLGTPGLTRESADYPGHGGAGVPIRDRLPEGLLDPVEYNPGGLAVVWAEENRRESIFDALWRRETYATSGPRMVVRFFGGFDLPEDLCEQPDFAARADAAGVPMGGELAGTRGDAAGGAPRLAVWALRDPGSERAPGLPLQRIQIVKASVVDGVAQERVIEVAGDPHDGADVDLASCTPRGAGFDSLCSVWTDPDFDASAPALYYARVVENPSCRWTQQVCVARGVDCARPGGVPTGLESCCDPAIPKTIQERAWTSPIWFTP